MSQNFKDKLYTVIKEGRILEGEALANHTSFRVGGPADYLLMPARKEEIKEAIQLAKAQKVPFFVIGNGSNLLVSDQGFRGLIIQIGKGFQEVEVEGNKIHAQAGALLSGVAKKALEHSLTGFEFAAGIPGSFGGAVCMNAGAYGGEMKQVLESVELLTSEGEFITLAAQDMDLSYRHSCVFDKEYIVIGATIRLESGDQEAIKERMAELAQARREKQPLEYPSAGSTFKRPEGYFAGKLIQDAGLKGYTVGGAQVSEKHSGFVINKGGASAEEICFLIKQVQKKVLDAYGVFMETEVRFLGFDQ